MKTRIDTGTEWPRALPPGWELWQLDDGRYVACPVDEWEWRTAPWQFVHFAVGSAWARVSGKPAWMGRVRALERVPWTPTGRKRR